MEKSYWNNNGKYQKFVNRINKIMPDWGYTENKYMNLFIDISKLYYDCYNNGGCNIKDFYMDRVANVKKYINLDIRRFIREEKYREDKTSQVFIYLLDKDFTYTIYKAYFKNWDFVSFERKVGYRVITFGDKKERDNWVKDRVEYCKAKLV